MRHAIILLSITALCLSAAKAHAQAPADPYQKPAAEGGSVDPYSRTMVNTKPAAGQAAVKPWEGMMSVDEAATRKNRLSGGHLFASPALFRPPLLASRFGFSQGVAVISGVRTVEGTQYELTAVGAHENLSAAARILPWLGLDLDLSFDALAGITPESALAMGGITNVDLSLGPVLMLPTIRATNTTFSIGTRLVVHFGLQISPIGGINAARKQAADAAGTAVDDSVKGQLITVTSYAGFRPSIGIVQPIFKWGGIQLEGGFARLSTKRSKATGKGDESESVNALSVGAAFSLDGRHLFNFPLVGVLEYYGDGLNTERRTVIGAGLYYQGLGEIQLGAFLANTIAKDPDISNYNAVVGQMTMIYYF